MFKRFLTALVLSLIPFSSFDANSDEMKVGYGYFSKGDDSPSFPYESYMTEVTYVFDEKLSLPYGLDPLIGALKAGTAKMVYAGAQKRFQFNNFAIIPSFAPGYFDDGDGKKMGKDLQFKSQIELAYEFYNGYEIGYAWSHISNANLGDVNPGSDNEMVFINKKF